MMRSSTFLCGVIVGVAASMYMSKKNKPMMSNFGQSKGNMNMGGTLGNAADKAKDKIMDMAMTSFGGGSDSSSASSNGSSSGNTSGSSSSQSSSNSRDTYDAPIKSKEENLRMLKDFIRSNPEVKREVEQILKETHTTIPGL
jgi:hypothetical protein